MQPGALKRRLFAITMLGVEESVAIVSRTVLGRPLTQEPLAVKGQPDRVARRRPPILLGVDRLLGDQGVGESLA